MENQVKFNDKEIKEKGEVEHEKFIVRDKEKNEREKEGRGKEKRNVESEKEEKEYSIFKHKISLRKDSTGREIINALILYGEYPISKLLILINKDEATIRKTVARLEREDYIEVNRAWNEKSIRLSKAYRIHIGLDNSLDNTSRDMRKLSRANRLTETQMMLDRSAPPENVRARTKEVFFDMKAIRALSASKALTTTRLNGVYKIGKCMYSLYNINKVMTWTDRMEQTALVYISSQIKELQGEIKKGIFFISEYSEALKILAFRSDKPHSYITPRTCYEEMLMIPINEDGINQLSILRHFEDIEARYLNAVFSESEILMAPNAMIDGVMEDTNTVVMFNADITKVSGLIDLLQLKMLPHKLNIICFDFQADFYLEAFKDFPDIEIMSYTVKDVRSVLGI